MKKEFLVLLQTTTNPIDTVTFDMFLSTSNGGSVIFEQVNFLNQEGQLPTVFTDITKIVELKGKQNLMELLNSKRNSTNENPLLLKEGQSYNSLSDIIAILVDEYEKLIVWEIELDSSTREKFKVEIHNSL